MPHAIPSGLAERKITSDQLHSLFFSFSAFFFFSFFLLILFLDKALNIFFEDLKIEIKKWLEDHQKPEEHRPEDDADWWKK